MEEITPKFFNIYCIYPIYEYWNGYTFEGDICNYFSTKENTELGIQDLILKGEPKCYNNTQNPEPIDYKISTCKVISFDNGITFEIFNSGDTVYLVN